MDKSPTARARTGAHGGVARAAPRLFDDTEGTDTRAKILAAALRCSRTT